MYNNAVAMDTSQISDHKTGSTESFRAVDGSMGIVFGDGHCMMTSFIANPWWTLDLGQVMDISQVHILGFNFHTSQTGEYSKKYSCSLQL